MTSILPEVASLVRSAIARSETGDLDGAIDALRRALALDFDIEVADAVGQLDGIPQGTRFDLRGALPQTVARIHADGLDDDDDFDIVVDVGDFADPTHSSVRRPTVPTDERPTVPVPHLDPIASLRAAKARYAAAAPPPPAHRRTGAMAPISSDDAPGSRDVDDWGPPVARPAAAAPPPESAPPPPVRQALASTPVAPPAVPRDTPLAIDSSQVAAALAEQHALIAAAEARAAAAEARLHEERRRAAEAAAAQEAREAEFRAAEAAAAERARQLAAQAAESELARQAAEEHARAEHLAREREEARRAAEAAEAARRAEAAAQLAPVAASVHVVDENANTAPGDRTTPDVNDLGGFGAAVPDWADAPSARRAAPAPVEPLHPTEKIGAPAAALDETPPPSAYNPMVDAPSTAPAQHEGDNWGVLRTGNQKRLAGTEASAGVEQTPLSIGAVAVARVDAPAPQSVQSLLNEAAQAMRRGDLAHADAVVKQVLEREPRNAEALALRSSLRRHMADLRMRALEPMSRIPRQNLRVIMQASNALNPRLMFVLGLVDGTLSLSDLIDLSGAAPDEAAELLLSLVEQGFITFR